MPVAVVSFGFAVVVVGSQRYYLPYAILGHLVRVVMDHALFDYNEKKPKKIEHKF